MEFNFKKHTLKFKFPAGTSRGVMNERDIWIVKVFDPDNPEVFGLGECAPLKGLSVDDIPDFEKKLHESGKALMNEYRQRSPEEILEWVSTSVPGNLPSVKTGFETAFLDFLTGGRRVVFWNQFVEGRKRIPINGLIWMGEKIFMLKQAREKLQSGYRCIKIKVGALDFQEECELMDFVRVQYPLHEIELRLDANGAFDRETVFEKLNILSNFHIHSIEQPIKPGDWELMREICAVSPIPVALDEELIGVDRRDDKMALLETIKPQYIVLKPSLLGGFKATGDWIQIAESMGIKWWITSALESNIGLNAIAQFTASYHNDLYQGLGTGRLYHNNILSPIVIEEGKLKYDREKSWEQIFFD